MELLAKAFVFIHIGNSTVRFRVSNLLVTVLCTAICVHFVKCVEKLRLLLQLRTNDAGFTQPFSFYVDFNLFVGFAAIASLEVRTDEYVTLTKCSFRLVFALQEFWNAQSWNSCTKILYQSCRVFPI